MKTEIVHQISDTDRHDDRLIGCNLPQRAPIQMIEVCVRYENEINLRQMMYLEAGLLEPLDHLQPFRPVWIDKQIDFVRLNKERRVPDPGDANFAWPNFWKLRLRMEPRPFDEKRGNKNAR